MQDTITTVFLITFVTLTSYVDLRYKKIFNWINVLYLILGLAVNYYFIGFPSIFLSFSGFIIGLLILLIPFIFGWVGGGDIKFLAAAGAWVGPLLIIYSTLLGLIFSGIAALVYLTAKNKLRFFISQLKISLINWRYIFLLQPAGKLPLGLFLGLGLIVTWLYFTFFK